jgi:hypothetical protein
MAVTYTTTALVKKRLKVVSSLGLDDADIEENIYEAEGAIDAVMRDSLKTGFDPVKHAIVRQCCTDLAAYLCLIYDPTAFASLPECGASATLLWYSAERSLNILEDPRTGTYLKSL